MVTAAFYLSTAQDKKHQKSSGTYDHIEFRKGVFFGYKRPRNIHNSAFSHLKRGRDTNLKNIQKEAINATLHVLLTVLSALLLQYFRLSPELRELLKLAWSTAEVFLMAQARLPISLRVFVSAEIEWNYVGRESFARKKALPLIHKACFEL